MLRGDPIPVGRLETRSADRRWAIHLLGARIDCLRMPDLLRIAVESARSGLQLTVMYVNVHCMNVLAHDVVYRQILTAADVVYCDGTGVRLGATLSGHHLPQRMTGADWIDPLCSVARQNSLSIFLLGGGPDSAGSAARILQRRHPGLRIVGTMGGFDLPSDVIQTINRSHPHILLVGMGTPRQEKWIASCRDEIEVPVVWAVGALFDFVNGRIPRGPRWMTEHGLEWVCRLAAEPRKLWRRYVIGNPLFLLRVVRQYWIQMPLQRLTHKVHRR